jgi:hypothetical protein
MRARSAVGVSVGDIADAVTLLLSDRRAVELGLSARARVMERYSWDARLAPLDALSACRRVGASGVTVAVPQTDFRAGRGAFSTRDGSGMHGDSGGAWAMFLLLFRRDAIDLATIYWTNTTFGHCLFVAPVIGWLVWQRRRELALVQPQGWWPGLALVASGWARLAARRCRGVALFRHAGLVLMLQGLQRCVLGPNVSRALLFPLAYMLFLVPFGDFLEGPLQDITSRW